MRKLWIVFMSLVMMFLLLGCAMENEYPQEVSLYSNLSYDTHTLTFTNTAPYDILYETGNAWDDFVIVHSMIGLQPLTLEESNAYQHVFDIIDELSLSTLTPIGDIFNYSSETLNSTLRGYGIVLTIDDIVSFNAIKSIIHTIEENTYEITKIDYIERRLSISLSEHQKWDLELLQDVMFEFMDVIQDLPMKDVTFNEFISRLNSMGYTPSSEETSQLENAHQIILELIKE